MKLSEAERWASLCDDEHYQYADTGPIHRRAIECRNEEIGDLRMQLREVATAAHFPLQDGMGEMSERLAAYVKGLHDKLWASGNRELRLADQNEKLKDLVHHLWLFTGRKAVEDMTTEQKELFVEITGDDYAQELLRDDTLAGIGEEVPF